MCEPARGREGARRRDRRRPCRAPAARGAARRSSRSIRRRACSADVLAPAEHLPFADGSFDVVVTRIAPHHFADDRRGDRRDGARLERRRRDRGHALLRRLSSHAGSSRRRSAAPWPLRRRQLRRRRLRVARTTSSASRGGREMARVVEARGRRRQRVHRREVEEAEKLRDPTHVRNYSEEEWRELLESAGLEIERVETFAKTHDLEAWLARTGAPARTPSACASCSRRTRRRTGRPGTTRS